MKFYTVADAYIAYLKNFDSKIPNNYSGKRPYVGIVLVVNDHTYLAPLTSHKPKHDRIASSSPAVFKIHEKGNETNRLGMLQLNNMIPVLEAEIFYLDFATQAPSYRALLEKQLAFIKSNQDALKTKAAKIHRLVTVNQNSFLCGISCDFTKLETVYRKFGQA